MQNREVLILKTSVIGILVNILLAVFKAIIGVMANSLAITLDAINNLTDAISNIITIIGVKLSGKAPDRKHPFGYGRIEYLATLTIAILIIYAGLTSVTESIKGIFSKELPEYNTIMLIVISAAVIVKIFLGLYFIKKGEKANADSLKASGKEALFDSVISAITVITAIIFLLTSISLEAYLAVIISIFIIKAGMEILIETVSKILGEGASVELVKTLKKEIASHEGVNGAYDLVLHNYGEDKYIASVHIEIDEDMPANDIDILTRKIMEDVENKHGVFLSAVGIYSHAISNDEIIALREKVQKIVLKYNNVHQMHGFYADTINKKIRFDMVVSFDEKNRPQLYENILSELKKELPEYEIMAGIDSDFNEI